MSQNVEAGDIWRMCQTKTRRSAMGEAGRDPRPRLRHAGDFWLDRTVLIEAQIITRSRPTSSDHDTSGLISRSFARSSAHACTPERMRRSWPGHHPA